MPHLVLPDTFFDSSLTHFLIPNALYNNSLSHLVTPDAFRNKLLSLFCNDFVTTVFLSHVVITNFIYYLHSFWSSSLDLWLISNFLKLLNLGDAETKFLLILCTWIRMNSHKFCINSLKLNTWYVWLCEVS